MLPFGIGLVLMLLYSNLFEWYMHRYWMHGTKKVTRLFSKRHNKHHCEHLAGRAFFSPMKESSLIPLVWLVNLPIYWLVAKLGTWAWLGTVLGAAIYITGYVFVHYHVHNAKTSMFRNTAWLKFIAEYHRIHHRWPSRNFNVFIPFTDKLLGTYYGGYLKGEKPADRPIGWPAYTGTRSVLRHLWASFRCPRPKHR
jgi:hypothetical protein